MSNSLQLHRLQQARLPCPSLSPGVCSNSCPLSRWCHATISSSVALFSCPQSFPASQSFLMSLFFTSGGQSTRASASVPPVNIQDWLPLGLTGLISLLSKGLLKSLLQHHSLKVPIFWCSTFFWPNSYLYITIGKTIALTIQTFASKVMSLLFNTLSMFVIAFLPTSSIFQFRGCSHQLLWFWSQREWNLRLFSLFPHLFAMK